MDQHCPSTPTRAPSVTSRISARINNRNRSANTGADREGGIAATSNVNSNPCESPSPRRYAQSTSPPLFHRRRPLLLHEQTKNNSRNQKNESPCIEVSNKNPDFLIPNLSQFNLFQGQ